MCWPLHLWNLERLIFFQILICKVSNKIWKQIMHIDSHSDSKQSIFQQNMVLGEKLCRPLQQYRFSPIGPTTQQPCHRLIITHQYSHVVPLYFPDTPVHLLYSIILHSMFLWLPSTPLRVTRTYMTLSNTPMIFNSAVLYSMPSL